MKRQLCALLAAVMVLALLLTGCGSEQQKAADPSTFVTLTDDLGRQVEFKAKPARIVVTSASFLEPLEAVGGADLVVGRPDSKTKMPAYAKDITSVGKVYQIDTEKIIGYFVDHNKNDKDYCFKKMQRRTKKNRDFYKYIKEDYT